MDKAAQSIHAIRQMIERAGAAETVEDATRWILDVLEDIVPADVKAFVMLEDDGVTLRIKTASGIEPDAIGRFERSVGTGILAEVVWSGRAHGIREADPASDEYKELRLDRAFKSGVVAPVGIGGRHFGYLWVQADTADAFDLTQFNIVALSASLAGEVISHIIARSECALHVPVDLETGLLRHVEFSRRLSAEIARAGRGGMPVSVMMLRLDGLHRIRSRGGKAAVTAALREFTRLTRGTLRGVDFLGLGAQDKIEVCLPDTPPDDSLKAADRVRAKLVQNFGERHADAQLTLGVGVAAFPDNGLDGRAVLARATEAALASHRGGGAKAMLSDEPPRE
jgi:diguanylate cyclase (GGDEF)-like protein